MPNETNVASKQGLSKQQVVMMLGIFVVIVIAVVVLILFLRQPEELAAEPVAGARLITPENVNQIAEEARATVERGMFMTHMNVIWNFADGVSPSYNAVMGNSSNNTYPMWFTVTIDATGQQVFESGLIPVGTTIAEIKLAEDLEPGSYDSTVSVNLVEEDGVTPVETNMGFGVELVVES